MKPFTAFPASLRHPVPALVCLVILWPAFAGCEQPQAERPNVLPIMTDDQGYGDYGVAGNPYVKTPVLYRPAAESTRFLNDNGPIAARKAH